MEWVRRRGVGLVVVLLVIALAEDAAAKKKDYYQLLEVISRFPDFVGPVSLVFEPSEAGPGSRGFTLGNLHLEGPPGPRCDPRGERQLHTLPFSHAH